MATHERDTGNDTSRPHNVDQKGPTKPDPDQKCGPWDLPEVDPPKDEAPCHCDQPPQRPPDPCRRPPRAKDKDDDCCEQILEILRGLPGGSHIHLKKPKQSVKVKRANLCCKLPVKDAIVPILLLFLRRFLNGTSPANAFEKNVRKFLAGLTAAQRDALKLALDAYDKLPPSIRQCAFETRFDECDNEALLDPNFIFKVWLNEAIHLGRATLFGWTGALGVGGSRPWDQTFVKPANGGGTYTLTAPWPWICQVNPGSDNRNWFKNREVTWPGNLPLNIFRFENFEFSKECTQIPDPGDPSKFKFDCHNKRPPAPPPPAPGGFGTFASNCENNIRYDFPDPGGTVCLTVPKAFPGQGIALRGLNFLSLNCKARLRLMGGGFQDLLLDCSTMGDTETPLMRDGKVVATCEVRDILTFTIPEKVKIGVNDVPVPPGRYTLEVIVPNDTKYAPTPGVVPAEFTSNDVWIDIQPSPNQVFRLKTDEAFCIEETDGPGSDEPWFQAYRVQFAPSEAGTGAVNMLPQEQLTIMRTDDVDSGEWITYSAPDLFKGTLKIGEVVAIAVYGLEVDSDDAAEQQVKDFGDAYALYWKNFFTQFAATSDVGLVTALIGKGVATATSLAVGAAVLAGIAVIGLFYAAWAPADPIGYDIMVFDAMMLFDLTDPKAALPAAFSNSFDELSLEVNPINPKNVQPGGTQAIYSEDHIYRSSDEDSTYRLVYRVERI